MPGDDEAIQLLSIWLPLSFSPKTLRAEHLAKEGRWLFVQIRLETSSHMASLQEPLAASPVPLSFLDIMYLTMVCSPINTFLPVSPCKGQNKLALMSENEASHCFCRNNLDSSPDLMHFRGITHEPPPWPHRPSEKTWTTPFLLPTSCYRAPTEQAGVADFSKGKSCSVAFWFCSLQDNSATWSPAQALFLPIPYSR